MPNCPRCQQPVSVDAVTCSYCQEVLKAYGHPGIPLHKAIGNEPLCKSCTYDADDSCTLPKRPEAKECTLYDNRFKPETPAKPKLENSQSFRLWVEKNIIWVIVIALIIISLAITLSQ